MTPPADPHRPTPQLGRQVSLPASPAEAVLERVPNPHPDTAYLTRFACPEFTSLCPVTGQPDFAHLVIDYVPGAWLVESKSLKLFLFAFRNEGSFYEDVTNRIFTDLTAVCKPRRLIVTGDFTARGGIRSSVRVDSQK